MIVSRVLSKCQFQMVETQSTKIVGDTHSVCWLQSHTITVCGNMWNQIGTTILIISRPTETQLLARCGLVPASGAMSQLFGEDHRIKEGYKQQVVKLLTCLKVAFHPDRSFPTELTNLISSEINEADKALREGNAARLARRRAKEHSLRTLAALIGASGLEGRAIQISMPKHLEQVTETINEINGLIKADNGTLVIDFTCSVEAATGLMKTKPAYFNPVDIEAARLLIRQQVPSASAGEQASKKETPSASKGGKKGQPTGPIHIHRCTTAKKCKFTKLWLNQGSSIACAHWFWRSKKNVA